MPSEIRRLDSAEVAVAIAELGGWQVVDGKLHRDFVFSNFVDAIGFMMKASIAAERLNHHPEWSNLYNTVHVSLETHDVGGISPYDIELAATMNDLAS